jgi:hypothetical protein
MQLASHEQKAKVQSGFELLKEKVQAGEFGEEKIDDKTTFNQLLSDPNLWNMDTYNKAINRFEFIAPVEAKIDKLQQAPTVAGVNYGEKYYKKYEEWEAKNKTLRQRQADHA